MKKICLLLALGMLICLPGMAMASTVTFDDLPTPNNSGGALWGVVPTSYAGFTWTGFEVIENSSYNSVYSNDVTFPSPPNAAYNGGTGNLTVTINFGTPLNVTDAYFSSWANVGSASATSVTLNGYNAADTLLYTLYIPLTVDFLDDTIHFAGVTSMTITSSAAGQYWLMDNLTTVPLPPTVLLLGSGLAGLAGLGWRWRRKTA